MRDPNEIRTFHGINMDPFHPRLSDICIEDIAHALAMLCRANGHIGHFYSVAQHCLNCEKEAEARGMSLRTRLFSLLHDATECYISDLTRPVKRHFKLYYQVEAALAEVIYDALCRAQPTPEEFACVGLVDDCLLYYEFLELCDEKMFDEEPPRFGALDFSLRPFDAVIADYLARYHALTKALEEENRG